MRRKTMIGERFGKLVVLEVSHDVQQKTGRTRYFKCQCDCGKTKAIPQSSLTCGRANSCGCLIQEKSVKRNSEKIIGKRFGRLQVASRDGVRMIGKYPITYYNCVCDCGNVTTASASDLNQGKLVSCGCYRQEQVGDKHPRWNSDKTDEEREFGRRIPGAKHEEFTRSVYERDGFKCQLCGTKGKINAHHLDAWNWCKERRYDQDNLITLCTNCHKKFHKEYGVGDNTAEQFYEFEHNFYSTWWANDQFGDDTYGAC